MKKLLFLLVIAIVSLSSCDRDDNRVTPDSDIPVKVSNLLIELQQDSVKTDTIVAIKKHDYYIMDDKLVTKVLVDYEGTNVILLVLGCAVGIFGSVVVWLANQDV